MKIESQNQVTEETQGRRKMKRYINDLIRNKPFVKSVKKLLKIRQKDEPTPYKYEDMTPEQKSKHDYVNKEIGEIIKGYEKLRKRCKKLLRDDYMKIATDIAEEYGLDGIQIQYIEHLLANNDKKNSDTVKYLEELAELDMCKVENLYDTDLNPLNKGEEIIYLDNQRQLLRNAYPVAICIHPRAAKRDVLDFVKKKWLYIEAAMYDFSEGKKLKYRKRKYSQELRDIIWENRTLPTNRISQILDEKFPNNDLLYFDINKIKSLEKKKRLSKIS